MNGQACIDGVTMLARTGAVKALAGRVVTQWAVAGRFHTDWDIDGRWDTDVAVAERLTARRRIGCQEPALVLTMDSTILTMDSTFALMDTA